MKTPASKAFFICIPILALVLGLVEWNPSGDFWGTIETPKAQCEAYDSTRIGTLTSLSPAIYSEAKILRLIREPQNTVSNLLYAWVGFAILLAANRWTTLSLGFGCIFLGFGSGLYHAMATQSRD